MIRALLPPIHARPTGGNLYNRRILRALGALTPVRTHVALPNRRDDALWLVDSLSIDAEIEGAVLVAHYLHLIDPDRRESAAAENERKHLARYRAVVTTSEYARAALANCSAIAIPPGLDERYRREVRPRRNAVPRIVTVANFFPDKGLLTMIDVLESMTESMVDTPWEWHLAGDASLDNHHARIVRERLARSPIAPRVRLHGSLSPARVAALYDRCDIFALASRFETCSMATREAMSRGLPVVAFAAGGLAANLPAETAHLLAPSGDSVALAAALRRLVVDRDERERAGRANRDAAMRFPSWEDSAKALYRFLGTMTESHPS